MYIAAGAALAVCLPLNAALAQTVDDYIPTSTIDTYRNVRPTYSARRSVGVFQNEQQRKALRGFQNRGRHVDQRGGFNAFALPGDRLPRIGAGTARGMLRPVPSGPLSKAQRSAFAKYGGFGRRSGRAKPGDIVVALTRRQTLIAATSLNAPVHRAFLHGTGSAMRSAVERTPFLPSETPEGTAPPSSLDQWLRSGVDVAHKRVRERAWGWFREGRYQRAARAFETAVSLEPLDAESRIGELFCHLSLRARRTALVVFRELTIRDDNVFLHELTEARVRNLTGVFGEAQALRRVRATAKLRSGPSEQNPDVRALHTLALWYLGKYYEAAQAATALARSFPDAAYADWPAKMEAARTKIGSEP